jgi:hypothetical protein
VSSPRRGRTPVLNCTAAVERRPCSLLHLVLHSSTVQLNVVEYYS